MCDIHLSIFLQLTQHDYTATLELTDHPPEVIRCVLQRTLCGYVFRFLLVALQQRNALYTTVYILYTYTASLHS